MHKFAVLLLVLGTGCLELGPDAEELGDPGEAEATSEATSELTTAFALTPAKLGATKQMLAGLAATRLSDGAPPLVDIAEIRDVVAAVIACALPAGQSLDVKADDTLHRFHGRMGLAPGWTARPPSVSERRWVSACLAAQTFVDTPGFASMRSEKHLAFKVTPSEAQLYPEPEGAFYGDLFHAAPAIFACGARAWTPPTAGAPRSCALSADRKRTDCGFTYTGSCTTPKTPCSDSIAPFGACSAPGASFGEVVTVYTKRP